MASLSQTGSTTSSVTLTVSGLDSAHSRTRYFWWQLYQNGSVVSEHGSQMAPGGTSHSTTFTGLNSGTTYAVLCGIYDDSGYSDLLALLNGSATTDTPTYYNVGATLHYDANGGSGAPSDNVFSDSQSTTSTANVAFQVYAFSTPTKSGHRFTGWKYGNTIYQPGDVFFCTATTAYPTFTLVAQWEAVSYNLSLTLSFDANGGSGAPSAVTETYQNSDTQTRSILVTLPATIPTRSGYDFLYWEIISGTIHYVSPGGTIYLTATEAGAQYTATAQWQKSTGPYIWNGSEWKRATPYIWNGSAWVQAEADVYDGSGWQP